MNEKMKIVVIGGSGLIGTKVVNNLRQRGSEVVAASPSTGINTITGEGLADALAGARVVVDVANAPIWEDKAVLEFFETSARNLLAAEATAGVGHHVALSIVGVDGLPDSGYMRAKAAQEKLIVESRLPYSIVRATQFHEFAEAIVASLTVGEEVRVPDALIQPISAEEVAAKVASVAAGAPLNGIVNIGGPDFLTFADLARTVLAHRGTANTVVVDPRAGYFGTPVGERSLVTRDDGEIATKRLSDWLG
jgi:uncharacterized protein YbjT (DUF2867 family)